MELKELYQTILTVFDAESVSELSAKMFDFITNNNTEAFEQYIPLCPDFETDYLQKIWQFYAADRKEKKQDYTPACLGELLSALIGNDEKGVIYDCCAGSGSLTIQRWIQNKSNIFICEELDERIIPFLLFNLAVRNMEGYVIHGNALTQERYKIFELKKGKKYSAVREVNKCERPSDFGISNPPYNIPWTPQGELLDDRFSEFGAPSKNNANYAFILHVLSRVQNKAIFILPMSVLEENIEIRKKLLDNGLIQAVITLPRNMFESTDIGTCVILFDKTQKNERVVFIDCRKFYDTKIREQRGEGGVHYQRVYKKELNVFTGGHIQKIVQAIRNKNREIEFCAAAHVVEIQEKGCSLVPSQYIEFVERREPHRPFKEIANDINRCVREKNKIKLTVNETIARELGLDIIADLMRQDNELVDTMNAQGLYKQWGIEFEKAKYITLTKNKSEVRIEQIDKEEISHLLLLIFPQLQQHIFYLNNRENEYLAELRDAILPGLMDGSISIEPKVVG